MKKISRDQARRQHQKRYFTGTRCKHGHIAPRYVCSTACIACQSMPRAAPVDRVWVALTKPDHDALAQFLQRAEQAGEIKLLTAFIRRLLRQAGVGPHAAQR